MCCYTVDFSKNMKCHKNKEFRSALISSRTGSNWINIIFFWCFSYYSTLDFFIFIYNVIYQKLNQCCINCPYQIMKILKKQIFPIQKKFGPIRCWSFLQKLCNTSPKNRKRLIDLLIYIFDILFRHIKSFLRFHLAFGFALQTLFSIDFSKIH